MSRRGVDLSQDFPGGSDAEVKAVSAAAKPFRVVSSEGDVLRETSRYDQLAEIYQVPDQFEATSYTEGSSAFEPNTGGRILLGREVLCVSLLNSITVGIPSAGDIIMLKNSREVDGVALMWPGSTAHNAGKLVPVIFEHTRNRLQLSTEDLRRDYYHKKFNNTKWIANAIRIQPKLAFLIQHEGSYYRVNSEVAHSMIEDLMTWIVGMTPDQRSSEVNAFWTNLDKMRSIEIRVRSPQGVDHGYVSALPVGYYNQGNYEVSHLHRPESACSDGDLKQNMSEQGVLISRSRSQPGATFSSRQQPSTQRFVSMVGGRIPFHDHGFASPGILQHDSRFCQTPGSGYWSPVAFASPMPIFYANRSPVMTVPMQRPAAVPASAPMLMQMPAPALQAGQLGCYGPDAFQGPRSAFL
jgi:hypothetical protein